MRVIEWNSYMGSYYESLLWRDRMLIFYILACNYLFVTTSPPFCICNIYYKFNECFLISFVAFFVALGISYKPWDIGQALFH